MRILVSGASGFIGAPLFQYLTAQGHTVVPLIRTAKPNAVVWDPQEGKAVPSEFEGFDAVIHLAGDPLTLSRWGQRKKKRILFSRTVSTWFLSHLLSTLIRPPRVFLCASAFGYYGDRGEELLDETSPPGNLFLSRVCIEWEKASQSLESRGTRVLHTRFGIVLGPGGALKKMALVYRFGLGAILGTGQQWVSWIHRHDLIHALSHLLFHTTLDGPINLVSPYPVRQKDFSQALAHQLHRPALFRIPAPLLRLLLGESADNMLLASARVAPVRLLASGFTFKYPLLPDALSEKFLLKN